MIKLTLPPIPRGKLLADIDPADPHGLPPLSLLFKFKKARNDQHLIIRTHGTIRIPDHLNHSQFAYEFPGNGFGILSLQRSECFDGEMISYQWDSEAGEEEEPVDIPVEGPWGRGEGDGFGGGVGAVCAGCCEAAGEEGGSEETQEHLGC